jgi:hypothetical protein
MTLAETLLPKLNEWTPTGPGRHSWSHSLGDSGWVLSIAADRVDSLGCLLWEMVLLRNGDVTDNATLKARAVRIAERATGLLEPILFVELDETRCEALLRSESPTKRGPALAYYDIVMTAGQKITVRRFSNNPDKSRRREQMAFALTHEAIAKLVDDLIGG